MCIIGWKWKLKKAWNYSCCFFYRHHAHRAPHWFETCIVYDTFPPFFVFRSTCFFSLFLFSIWFFEFAARMNKVWEQWAERLMTERQHPLLRWPSLCIVSTIVAFKYNSVLLTFELFRELSSFGFWFLKCFNFLLSDINDQLDAYSVRFKFYKWNEENGIWNMCTLE